MARVNILAPAHAAGAAAGPRAFGPMKSARNSGLGTRKRRRDNEDAMACCPASTVAPLVGSTKHM
jgi:hypothetical protein